MNPSPKSETVGPFGADVSERVGRVEPTLGSDETK
jgi:hypothetical protein